MKKILLLFLAAVLTGCGIYLAFYIYGGYREDKEIKDSMKSVELLQSQAVVPEEDTGDGQAPDDTPGICLPLYKDRYGREPAGWRGIYHVRRRCMHDTGLCPLFP